MGSAIKALLSFFCESDQNLESRNSILFTLTAFLGTLMACNNQRQGDYPQRVCPPVKSEPCRVLSASVLEETWVMAPYEITPGMTPKSDHWCAEMQPFSFAKDGHFKHLILLGDNNTTDLLETISRPSPHHQTYELKNGYLWIKHPERDQTPYCVLEFQQDLPQACVKKVISLDRTFHQNQDQKEGLTKSHYSHNQLCRDT